VTPDTKERIHDHAALGGGAVLSKLAWFHQRTLFEPVWGWQGNSLAETVLARFDDVAIFDDVAVFNAVD
jgi:hypothetical protein